MCFRRLRRFSVLSALYCLLYFLPLSSLCYADVILTDSEAQKIMTEIQESKKESQSAKDDLLQSQEELKAQREVLTDVMSDYVELKTSCEKQLEKAERQSKKLKFCVTVTSVSTIVETAVIILMLIL